MLKVNQHVGTVLLVPLIPLPGLPHVVHALLASFLIMAPLVVVTAMLANSVQEA